MKAAFDNVLTSIDQLFPSPSESVSSLMSKYQINDQNYSVIRSIANHKDNPEDQFAFLNQIGENAMTIIKQMGNITTELKQLALSTKENRNVLSSGFGNIDMKAIKSWIGGNPQLKLLYRATRDGFAAKKFHEKCDNQGATLVIAKTSFDKIIGGYTTLPWQSTSD